jgi:hypothetical protein
MPVTKSRSEPLSLQKLLQEKQEMEERQAQRAHVKELLAENIDDIDVDDDAMYDDVAENALGKESSDKLKASLQRIGGDMRREGSYHFFRHKPVERTFDPSWIKNVGWLSGFDGIH